MHYNSNKYNKTMANWEILNSKFNNALDSMTDELWDYWAANRINRKNMRRMEMLLKAKLQSEKILLSQLSGKCIFDEKSKSSENSSIEHVSLSGVVHNNESPFALAA